MADSTKKVIALSPATAVAVEPSTVPGQVAVTFRKGIFVFTEHIAAQQAAEFAVALAAVVAAVRGEA